MKEVDLCFIPNNDNIFSIQVYVPLGSIHEKKGQAGISHLLEHMKFRKSNRYGIKKFIEVFNKVPHFNAYTTKDHTSYFIRSNNVDDKYQDVIKLMYELTFNTSFSNNELEIEKKIVEEEKFTRDPDSESVLKIDMESDNSILAKTNPYNKNVIGIMKDLYKISNSNLKAYNNRYLNDYMIVISCPKKLIPDVKKMVLKLFPDSRKGKSKSKMAPNSNDNMPKTNDFHYSMIFRNFPVPQNNNCLIFKSYSEKDPNKFYMEFIKNFLIDGKGSILGNILREKNGFIYSLQSMYEGYKHYGCFRILISSNKKNKTNNILKITFNEIQKLKENELDQKTFKKYQKHFMDEINLLFKNNDYLISMYGKYLYYDRDFTLDKYRKFIADITPTSLRQQIISIFNFKTMGLVSYGNYPGDTLTNMSSSVKKLIEQQRKVQDNLIPGELK
jgi:predicted Zn-dependent peptidase